MDISNLQQALAHAMSSQIFAGGSALALVGGLMAWGRKLPMHLWSFLLGRFTVALEIENTDSSFDWLCTWLDEHPYAKKARRLAVSTTTRSSISMFDAPEEVAGVRILFTPAPGEHLLWFKGRLMYLERKRSPPAEGGYSRQIKESMHLRIPARSQSILRELIVEAQKLYESDSVRPRIHVSSSDDWIGAGEIPKRDWDSVILPEGMSERILSDTQTFLAEERWYLRRGIPYRRGFLLHGPPGTGKSSTVVALANRFKMSLYVLNVGSKAMNDDRLMSLINSVPPRSFILMEDVDAAVVSRTESSAGEDASGMTLSGLLNAIDGVAATTGCITVLTTNHPERLDPALVRHGRVDEKYELTYATPWQAAGMFTLFYEMEDGAADFADGVKGRDISPAELQNILILNKNSPKEAIAELKSGNLRIA